MLIGIEDGFYCAREKFTTNHCECIHLWKCKLTQTGGTSVEIETKIYDGGVFIHCKTYKAVENCYSCKWPDDDKWEQCNNKNVTKSDDKVIEGHQECKHWENGE